MGNLASTMERGKVLTTGKIPRGQRTPLPHKCVDCGCVDEECECPKLDGYDRELMRGDRVYDELRGK